MSPPADPSQTPLPFRSWKTRAFSYQPMSSRPSPFQSLIKGRAVEGTGVVEPNRRVLKSPPAAPSQTPSPFTSRMKSFCSAMNLPISSSPSPSQSPTTGSPGPNDAANELLRSPPAAPSHTPSPSRSSANTLPTCRPTSSKPSPFQSPTSGTPGPSAANSVVLRSPPAAPSHAPLPFASRRKTDAAASKLPTSQRACARAAAGAMAATAAAATESARSEARLRMPHPITSGGRPSSPYLPRVSRPTSM
jgi:hypothetical protein